MSSKYPTFIGIGAQKAGTTWLYRNLQAHPGVWLPPEKELHYFDEKRASSVSVLARLFGGGTVEARWRRQLRRQARRARGGISLADVRWAARYFLHSWDDSWYASLFAPADGRVAGEVTPSYAMLDSERVADIKRLVPEARVVFLIRNPIERAWSHALMEVRNTVGSSVDSSEFVRHFESAGSRLRTDYVRTLDIWREHYPADQIFVGFLEDVHFHPDALLGRVCDFIGVAPLASWPDATSHVYAGSGASIPGDLAVMLARLYVKLTGELASRFGGYASWWRHCCRWLAEERSPPAVLSTPLYTGPIWTEWLAGQAAPSLQSGSLSLVERAAAVG